ncbi:MAG: MarR family transcriptional regulator [Verrucomicrobia bacterium]|nr:MarR family transcriptional regulator [Verrucomicrobiota bacterium]
MDQIHTLRHSSRKLVRELGIIQLDKSLAGPTPQHCHVIVEIGEARSGITVSKLAELLLMSVSAMSRLIQSLIERGLVEAKDGIDKREKFLVLTSTGKEELKNIDDFSNAKVEGAFAYLTKEDQAEIIRSIQKYAEALEKSRTQLAYVKIHTLSTSRPLRRQIVQMVEEIQKYEIEVTVTKELNTCILRAEETFYYNNSYNFWYATNNEGTVVGCIGLRKIDDMQGQLLKFFVDKRFRGKGLAQKLLATVEKAASKHGFSEIWVGTLNKLAATEQFYLKSGFSPVQEKKLPDGFKKCYLDVLFYSRFV